MSRDRVMIGDGVLSDGSTWYERWWHTLEPSQQRDMAMWTCRRTHSPPAWLTPYDMLRLICVGGQWSMSLRQALLSYHPLPHHVLFGVAFFEGPVISTVARLDDTVIEILTYRFGPILGPYMLSTLLQGLMIDAGLNDTQWFDVSAIYRLIRKSSPSEASWGYVWLLQHGVDIGRFAAQITDPSARLIWALWTDTWDSRTVAIIQSDPWAGEYLRARQKAEAIAHIWTSSQAILDPVPACGNPA